MIGGSGVLWSRIVRRTFFHCLNVVGDEQVAQTDSFIIKRAPEKGASSLPFVLILLGDYVT